MHEFDDDGPEIDDTELTNAGNAVAKPERVWARIPLDFDILSSERRVKLAKILQILAAATG